jgi:hypothetical protein
MDFSKVNDVVERLRFNKNLYLPALTERRGFSSSRVEHLLNGLVSELPKDECYWEIGTLEGRTLDAAAHGNHDKFMYACDPEAKYGARPLGFPLNVLFLQQTWQDCLTRFPRPVGLVFYDADHSSRETEHFMLKVPEVLANEAVLVLDDWDRATVRRGAFNAMAKDHRWSLLREMPEYTDGITCPPNHFGYYFGISVWGFRS